MLSRRLKIIVALIAAAALAYVLLPRFVANRVRAALVMRGFPRAELEVTSVGLDHLHMRNVHLEPGVEIGAIDLDRGISLLWKDVGRVSLRDARVDTTALGGLVRNARTLKSSSGPAKPVRLDVEVSVREPTARGLRVDARGSLVLGREIRLEDGHLDVTLPRRQLGGATIERATLTADVAGNLSTADVRARGTARGAVGSHALRRRDRARAGRQSGAPPLRADGVRGTTGWNAGAAVLATAELAREAAILVLDVHRVDDPDRCGLERRRRCALGAARQQARHERAVFIAHALRGRLRRRLGARRELLASSEGQHQSCERAARHTRGSAASASPWCG